LAGGRAGGAVAWVVAALPPLPDDFMAFLDAAGWGFAAGGLGGCWLGKDIPCDGCGGCKRPWSARYLHSFRNSTRDHPCKS
jgi:hypothetical protein